MVIRRHDQEVVDVAALGEEHQVCTGKASEERNQHGGQVGYVVEGEAVEHFAHVEIDTAWGRGDGTAELLEHRVVIDIQFDEGGMFAIDEGEIAVGAMVRTAVG